MTMLASSGSFFALTEAGTTLFAASSNGGSILLEKSTDRGLSWSPSLVPLYAVSGGAPWDLAVVAADGSDLVLTAASGLSYPGGGTGYYPGGPTGCNQNSTLLLASSHDGGLTWSSRAVYLSGEVITSLQAGIEGTQAAVAWIHQPVGACGATQGEVSAVSSTDAAASWTVWQNLTLGSASLVSDESLQMAPEGSGIVIAFLEQPSGASTASLGLWLDAQGSGSGFSTSPMLLPAPSSWTLQGDPDTPALLVTPTYLIPIQGTSLGSLTAIPFFQLQQDGGGTGQLPSLLSVVPLSSTRFEIAATLPQGDGVDCWQLGLVTDQVTQTCHVPLGSLLVPSSEQFPIVALLDGGGYWIAVGAAGTPTCYDVCPVGAQASTAGGGAAVGTSVCVEGCAAQQGLAAYAFNEGSTLSSSLVSAFSGLIVVAGLGWMVAARRARRRLASSDPPTAPEASNAPTSGTEPYRVLGTYRRGMLIWALAWIPLAIVLLVPNSSGDFGIAPWLAVLGGILGGIIVLPFHAQVRRTLQRVYGVHPERLFQEDPQTDVLTQDHVRWAAFFAYLSWIAGFLLVVLLLFSLSGAMDRTSASAYGGPGSSAQLGAGAFLLLASVLSVVLFRAIYHWQLSEAVLRVRAQMTTGSAETPVDPGLVVRTRVGTGLLVWNPFVGLLMGWAIQPVLPAAPNVLTLAFVPVTLLGILLLYGMFGKTTWTLEPVTLPSV